VEGKSAARYKRQSKSETLKKKVILISALNVRFVINYKQNIENILSSEITVPVYVLK